MENNKNSETIGIIAKEISNNDKNVVEKLNDCLKNPKEYFENNKEKYSQRSIDSYTNDINIQWIGMVDLLIDNGYAFELDFKCDIEDYLFGIHNIKGFEKLNITNLNKNFTIEYLVYETNNQIANKGKKLGIIDINSDSYVIFIIDIDKFKIVSNLASNINHKIYTFKKEDLQTSSELEEDYNLDDIINLLLRKDKNDTNNKTYAIIGVVLTLTPMVITACMTSLKIKNYILIDILSFVIFWGLPLIIMNCLNSNSKNKSKFYKIANAHNNFNIINITDEKTIKELYNNSALTFIEEPDPKLLDFIYNWLNYEKKLNGKKLNLYVYNGSSLKKVFNNYEVYDETKFISIFLNDLALNDSNLKKFNKDCGIVGAELLNNIVKK